MKDEFKNLTEEQIDSKVVDIAGFIGEQALKLNKQWKEINYIELISNYVKNS